MQNHFFRHLIIFSFTAFTFLSAQSKWDDWESGMFDWYGESRPLIEIQYGLGKLVNDNYEDGRFADIGSMELKLGYSELDSPYEDYLVELNTRYIFVSKLNNVLRSDIDVEPFQYESDLYRFGVGSREGYGYTLGHVSLIPYNQGGIGWSKFNKLERSQEIQPGFTELNPVQPLVTRYGKALRFGSMSEAGVKLEIANMIALNTSYEASVIYPRHKVWHWLGSFVIEQAGYAAIGHFVDEIMDRVPAAGPIMNVLLRGGYQYAFHLLKKEKMNWPFNSESPLAYEQFKFGITLTF